MKIRAPRMTSIHFLGCARRIKSWRDVSHIGLLYTISFFTTLVITRYIFHAGARWILWNYYIKTKCHAAVCAYKKGFYMAKIIIIFVSHKYSDLSGCHPCFDGRVLAWKKVWNNSAAFPHCNSVVLLLRATLRGRRINFTALRPGSRCVSGTKCSINIRLWERARTSETGHWSLNLERFIKHACKLSVSLFVGFSFETTDVWILVPSLAWIFCYKTWRKTSCSKYHYKLYNVWVQLFTIL